ncbi:MAG: DUF3048 domain-containing protein [Clostridiales bacterium]|nr:DUF3048 domain-containing protein [Clostridiales bacterium]
MKKLFIAAIAASAIFLLASCSPADEEAEPESSLPPVEVITPTPSPVFSPTLTPEETPYDGPRSPLSGLPVDEQSVNLRPLAGVINNRKVALPQLGVSKADIIVEVPVEGAYTRMVALFQDASDAGNIGSIRSARPYLIDIAQAFDSIFIHAGGSNDAYKLLKSRGIDRFDETNGPGSSMFFRDATRRKTMGLEHSLLTSSAKIGEYIGALGYRLEHEAGYASQLRFEDELEISGEKAWSVTLRFNSSKSAVFEYDGDEGLYRASQQGGDYVDGNTGEQLTFANLIIIKTSIRVIDSEGRLSIDLTSGGEGCFAVGGQYVPVTWSKASASEPFVFKDGSGERITLRTGRTYVAIMSNSAGVEFSEGQ